MYTTGFGKNTCFRQESLFQDFKRLTSSRAFTTLAGFARAPTIPRLLARVEMQPAHLLHR